LSSPPGPANQSLKLRLIYAGSYREQLLQIKQFLRSSLHRNAPSPLEAMELVINLRSKHRRAVRRTSMNHYHVRGLGRCAAFSWSRLTPAR